MKTTRRRVLLGSALATIATAAASLPKPALAQASPLQDEATRQLLTRMLRAMYPHKRFPDGPYQRAADAVLAAVGKTPGEQLDFASSIAELKASGFADFDEARALAHLKSIEGTAFFNQVRSTGLVAIYDDAEVWTALGYEGPSFDKGGYINRGFNDLAWLPDPRIEEYGEGQ